MFENHSPNTQTNDTSRGEQICEHKKRVHDSQHKHPKNGIQLQLDALNKAD